jgi:hypothetical protein
MGTNINHKYVRSRMGIASFVCVLVLLILVCGSVAFLFEIKNMPFASNMVLSIGSGLLTGVIILIYGNRRSNHKENAQLTYARLRQIKEIPLFDDESIMMDLDACDDRTEQYIFYDHYKWYTSSVQRTLTNVNEIMNKTIVPQKPAIFHILSRKVDLFTKLLSDLVIETEWRSGYNHQSEDGSWEGYEEIPLNDYYIIKNKDGSEPSDEQIGLWKKNTYEISELVDSWNNTYKEILEELDETVSFYSSSVI